MSPYTGLIGITALLILAYLMSYERRRIRWGGIICGLLLQAGIAWLGLKTSIGQDLFHTLGMALTTSSGNIHQSLMLIVQGSILKDIPTAYQQLLAWVIQSATGFLLACVLIQLAYYWGLIQGCVDKAASLLQKTGLSGAEAVSNTANLWIGQGAALLLIKPYLLSMTRSELLSVMAGSMSCIGGGALLFPLSSLPPAYVFMAGLMAIPGSLAISKIMFPETEESLTYGHVRFEMPVSSQNGSGLAEGIWLALKTIFTVGFLLAALTAAIRGVDFVLIYVGKHLASGVTHSAGSWDMLKGLGINWEHLTLQSLFTPVFSLMAVGLGIPSTDASWAGEILSQNWVVSSLAASSRLATLSQLSPLTPKSVTIVCISLSSFANLSAIAIPLGIVGRFVPLGKQAILRLGLKALLAASFTSLISAAMAGILVAPPGSLSWTELALPLGMMVAALMMTSLTQYIANRQLISPRPNPFIHVASKREPSNDKLF